MQGKQAIAVLFGTGKGIAVEHVDFFDAVAVEVGGGDADGLALAVGDDGVGGIEQTTAVPFEGQIGVAKARHKKFKLTVTINIADCNAITQTVDVVID